MTLIEFKNIATLAGILIAAVSLLIAALNSRINVRTNRAQFWLDLRNHFAKHDEVHLALRPGGSWSAGKAPQEAIEWAKLEAYMGLFEHCEIMLEQSLLDTQTFREIYAYRLQNIVANETIRTRKLIHRAADWSRFLALLKRMNIGLNYAANK